MHNIKIQSVDWNLKNTIRIKVFLINSKNEILLGISNGGCQLPGGHLERGESFKETLIREIKEETGIELHLDYKPEPFFELAYKNHEKCSRVLYFLINTDMLPNLENTHYTQSEIEANFTLTYVPYDNFINFVKNNIKDTQIEINNISSSCTTIIRINFITIN